MKKRIANVLISGTKKSGYLVEIRDEYLNMWSSMAVTEEEILVIKRILNRMFKGGEK